VRYAYAMRLAGTRMRNHPSRAGLTRDTKAGPVWTGEVRFNEEWLDQPLLWSRPRRIFVCAHGDLFHESVPDEWLDQIFQVMASAQRHVFQVLTKRAQRMCTYLSSRGFHPLSDSVWTMTPEWRNGECNLAATRRPLPNVWLGVSAENQEAADERIPLLLQTPAAVRWVSAEPLLGPVQLAEHGLHGGPGQLDWLVVGGESGPNARPMHPAWPRSLRDQCAAAGVPMHFKQWGEWANQKTAALDLNACYEKSSTGGWVAPDGTFSAGEAAAPRDATDAHVFRIGRKAAGRQLDGLLHDSFPEGPTP
jgi:protein gp37